jgi:hypothetical protein
MKIRVLLLSTRISLTCASFAWASIAFVSTDRFGYVGVATCYGTHRDAQNSANPIEHYVTPQRDVFNYMRQNTSTFSSAIADDFTCVFDGRTRTDQYLRLAAPCCGGAPALDWPARAPRGSKTIVGAAREHLVA